MRQVPPSSSPGALVVDRRRALGLGLGGAAAVALLTSGCDLRELTRDAPTGAAGTGEDPADDPDQLLVDGVLVDLQARIAAVAAARAAAPRLRRVLRPLEDMHRAHLEALTPAPGSGAPSAASTPTPSPAPVPTGTPLETVRADESTHQAALVTAAVAARSGALARLLASMSASVAQHVAVLPAGATA